MDVRLPLQAGKIAEILFFLHGNADILESAEPAKVRVMISVKDYTVQPARVVAENPLCVLDLGNDFRFAAAIRVGAVDDRARRVQHNVVVDQPGQGHRLTFAHSHLQGDALRILVVASDVVPALLAVDPVHHNRSNTVSVNNRIVGKVDHRVADKTGFAGQVQKDQVCNGRLDIRLADSPKSHAR